MVSKRINLKVHSLARLEGGSVSIAGDVDIDGVETAVQVVVDSAGWDRIAKNATWFAVTRNAPEAEPPATKTLHHVGCGIGAGACTCGGIQVSLSEGAEHDK